MIYDLYFHFCIAKEAGFGEDESGNLCETYLQLKLEECNTESRDPEKEDEAHKNMVNDLAEMLDTDAKYITPISKEEYDKHTSGDGGEEAVYEMHCKTV